MIRKTILLLNNDLPYDVFIYWVTAEVLWRWLIHSGVGKALILIMVQESLKRNNQNQVHLKVWGFGGAIWFRLAMMNHCESNKLPLGQHLNIKTNKMYRLNICPDKNYFIGSGRSKHFITLNNALLELKEDKGKENVWCESK